MMRRPLQDGYLGRLGWARPARLAALIGLAALATWALCASTADANTKWLCKPGHSPNPCRGNGGRLKTTVISSGGQVRVVDPMPARHPKVDCFYVYPTVTTQPGVNANLHIDPEEKGIARDQASRFSQTCRIYAPMYRQGTPNSFVTGNFAEEKAGAKVAYRDVRNAWRDYLAHFNHGRGVVLIGHSQGAVALRRLIREQIDPHPKVRRRLISAILPGGNVLVKKHKALGVDFQHIPGCRSARQTGCVIAYEMFDEPVEPDPRWGRPDGPKSYVDAWGLPVRGLNRQVLCTNPASLSGGAGRLHTILPTVPPASLWGALWSAIFNGNRPTAPTPWVTPQDHYSGRCVNSNGAHVLMLSPVGGAQHLAQPLPGYGLHHLDMELVLGNLTAVVRREATAYLKRSALG
jgi:hypothetical protein